MRQDLRVKALVCHVACHQTGHESHSMLEHGEVKYQDSHDSMSATAMPLGSLYMLLQQDSHQNRAAQGKARILVHYSSPASLLQALLTG